MMQDVADLAKSFALAKPVRQALLRDDRRIVVVGASGWIGRATIAGLFDALGEDGARQRLVCFGSSARAIEITSHVSVDQAPLAELSKLPRRPSLLFHLAFLTKDKVSGMDERNYRQRNRALSQNVLDALDEIGVDRLFVASSGAAAFANDPSAASDLRLYGELKREDEQRFSDWAVQAPGRRAALARIYALSGPFMNKHATYALASFILDALAGRPIAVRAPTQVFRGYVAVRELISLVFSVLLADDGEPAQRFATGGTPFELGEVARHVADCLGGHVERAPITSKDANVYLGDEEDWLRRLALYGLSHVPMDRQIVETAAYLSRISTA